MIRFQRTGDLPEISEAISTQQRAVQLTPGGHPDMPGRLNNLGIAFVFRFECTGDVSDLTEAISIHQRAVQLAPDGHSGMPGYLNNLGTAFQTRFGRTGDVSDLSKAISIQQQAVKLTPQMPSRLNNLGNSFLSRFGRTGNVSDLSEAISVYQRAVQFTPNGHSYMPKCLNNLATSYQGRFDCTGDISDISHAISVQQRALQLIPDSHPDMPKALNNLGNSLRRRFGRTRDVSDISEAILIQQQAVQLTPDGHPYMPICLNSLGVSFERRFERTGDLPDLSEAISVQRRGVQLTPDGHPYMSKCLNSLGSSFLRRFERTGNISHLSEAISVQQRAVQLTLDGHPDMPNCLNGLGSSFLKLFECTGNASNLSEAISIQQRVIQLAPNGHPDIPRWLNNLGLSFLRRFVYSEDLSDIRTATSTFQKSATTIGRPSARLTAARQWAQLSMTHDLPHPLTAYGVAINLVSEIAGMDRTVNQRFIDLIETSSLTTSAASAALILGDIEKALEWLEQGRCLVWNQLNQLRSPVDHLRAHDEHLAQRFLNISRALEASGSRHGSEDVGMDAPLSTKISLQEEAHLHIKLSRKWSELLDEIRQIPQFHNFLRPPQASDLLKHLPHDGIVILVNVHNVRCDGLALISGSDVPIHIPLTNFTHKEASDLRERLQRFLSNHRVRTREEDRGPRLVLEDGDETHSEIHFVLDALWLHVVKPILDGLMLSVSDSHFMIYHFLILLFKSPPASDPARIWWCPTGPLAFLPLHAAGIYCQNGRFPPGSCISDFAISSYTPTVSSLLEKLKVSTNTPEPALSKLLVISQPNTPGCSPIPATTKEMDCIWKAFGIYNGECHRLEGESATVSHVKFEMESHGSIHLACHARQDPDNPLKSGFYLQDGRLELSEIMKQKFAVRNLAFLSACQTSTGTEKLSEEAVHLAAGMLAAGYRSVVATMWSIKDQYGPVMAEGFYRDLMERGKASGQPGFGSSGSARALHHAIQGIRNTLGDTEQGLLTWVPYVHFGC